MRSSPSRQADLARLGAAPFAHRGLHGPSAIENSRAAFEAAMAAGFGIELDVQPSLDGFAFVFHDDRLDRLTDRQGCLRELEPDEVERIQLRGSRETIPSLAEVLALIGGRVPLLIELKARGPAYHQLCYHAARALHGYPGAVGVMSFNPKVGRWFSRHYAQILRGLVVSEKGKKGLRGAVERSLAARWARADFLAYDICDLPSWFASARRAAGLPVYTWTVRTRRDEEVAAAYADQIIHELPA